MNEAQASAREAARRMHTAYVALKREPGKGHAGIRVDGFDDGEDGSTQWYVNAAATADDGSDQWDAPLCEPFTDRRRCAEAVALISGVEADTLDAELSAIEDTHGSDRSSLLITGPPTTSGRERSAIERAQQMYDAYSAMGSLSRLRADPIPGTGTEPVRWLISATPIRDDGEGDREPLCEPFDDRHQCAEALTYLLPTPVAEIEETLTHIEPDAHCTSLVLAGQVRAPTTHGNAGERER